VLKKRLAHLDNQNRMLLEHGVQLLRDRTQELGFQAENPAELLQHAKEIVTQHKELEQLNFIMQHDVQILEIQHKNMVSIDFAEMGVGIV
jgi:hypothetical protein